MCLELDLGGDMTSSLPVVLSIGGSDCSAGAGVQADLKVFQRLNVYGLTAVTGVVAETPNQVLQWEAVSPDLLRAQLLCLFREYPISVVKVGLLFNEELVRVVAQALAKVDVQVVLDPVGSASAGGSFGGEQYRASVANLLFSKSTLVTPNASEARQFCGEDLDQKNLCLKLVEKYEVPFLVKGGHFLDESRAVDVLGSGGKELTFFELQRLNGPDFHGTGCTLASAISAYLARGDGLLIAVERGKLFLYNSMKKGVRWKFETFVTHALQV